MIMTIEEAKRRIDCGNMSDDLIEMRLDGIEAVIRAYTNNNFQNRAIRMVGRSCGLNVYGNPQHFAVGDTVQISGSGLNDGLYLVVAVTDDHLVLDGNLMITNINVVTKIQYPADVIQCACDLFAWKISMGDKVGVKSETISRHSVTYEDSATLFMGFPTGILNGLRLWKKARC